MWVWIIPGIFGPYLALLGGYPWPAWRAASKFEYPRCPEAPWKLENNPPFAAPSSGAAEQLRPMAGAVVFLIACWAQELDALAVIFRLLWHCCPVVSCPCGPVGAGISPACCRMHWLQLGARRHDGHKWIASSACTSTIHLPCLPVCLVILLLASLKVSISMFFSQPVLRGALTLGNWLILALCTSIRHRRVSKTLPSSASI